MADALKKFSYVVVGTILIFVIGYAIKILFFTGRVSTDDAQIDTHLISISSRIPGTVLLVLVDDNQVVKKGDPLVKLDQKDFRAKVNEANAAYQLAVRQYKAALLDVPVAGTTTSGALSQSQASLVENLAKEKSANEKIEQLQAAVTKSAADLAAAQAHLNLSESNYQRAKLLAQNYAASEQQFDAARTDYQNDLAAVLAAQSQLKQSQSELEQSKSDLDAAQAEVEEAKAEVLANSSGPERVKMKQEDADAAGNALQQAKAELQLANLDLSYTVVRAPADGIASQKRVTVGEVVSPGQQLLILAPTRDIWVTANFKETQLADIRTGEKATIKVDAIPGRTFHGKIDSFGGATGSATSLFPPENATGNFVKVVQRLPVKIDFDPDQNLSMLRTGMSVEATVYTRR